MYNSKIDQYRLIQIIGVLLIGMVSCHKPYIPVKVKLNVEAAPHLTAWGNQAKQLIGIWAPKIARIFDNDNFPHDIDLVIQKSEDGIAYTDSNKIVVSSHWIEKYPDDIGLIVHEAVHVVQLYPEFEPGWVTEGIADYIRWYLYEQKPLDWFPQGEPEKGYEAAYKITGGFFVWITESKNSNIIKLLNKAMKEGTYIEDIFHQETKMPLDSLWDEYFELKNGD